MLFSTRSKPCPIVRPATAPTTWSRAFMVALTYLRLNPNDRLGHRLASTYLSFLVHAQMEDGRFHNFMDYDRRWSDEVGTPDSCGRAIWALGYGIARAVAVASRLHRASRSRSSDHRIVGASPVSRVRGPRPGTRVYVGKGSRIRRCVAATRRRDARRLRSDGLRRLAVVRKRDVLRQRAPLRSDDPGRPVRWRSRAFMRSACGHLRSTKR